MILALSFQREETVSFIYYSLIAVKAIQQINRLLFLSAAPLEQQISLMSDFSEMVAISLHHIMSMHIYLRGVHAEGRKHRPQEMMHDD